MTTLPSTAPLDLASPWGGASRTIDLEGPLHWVDFGGPEAPADGPEPPPVVLVHGLGGSHLNWVGIAPALAERRRVVALDLPGFGLTPALGRDTSVNHNAALLSRFAHAVLGRPVVLVGNSMGGMVSLLLADRRPEQVVGLGLVDPALPNPGARPDPQVAATFAMYAVPRVGEMVLTRYNTRFSDRQRVLGTVALCFADPSRADDAVVEAGVELAAWRRSLPDPEGEFLGAARSLLRVLRGRREYDRIMRELKVPVLLIHGTRDRLVPISAARRAARLNPGWATAYLDGMGHTPQLEAPEDVLGHLEPWLDSLDASRPGRPPQPTD
ncbi:hydrolase [Terrabacter tumescens]|uniref:Hydrolase n=1 Tax=Terrabacter tumescens TaxID=60443 RepID=A0ABQ2HTC9_9MICO|nr:alpha/beta hydrolase [Terrabacter tumescens]GGM89300.1 hydrolase [Terrabacter tumescens]